MARIVLTSSGSSGDVNPVIALGLGLRERGHEVVLVLEERLYRLAASLGFDSRVMAGDLDAFFATHMTAILGAWLPETAATATRLFAEFYLVPHFASQVETLRAVCRGADLLVAPWLHHAATAAAELAGIPRVALVYSPLIVPSAYVMAYPPFRRLPRRLWPAANRFTWALGNRMFGAILDVPVNALRAELGLLPRKNLGNEGSLSTHLTAVTVSGALIQRPQDWPAHVQVTGFCFWDTPSEWTPSADLAAFLNAPGPLIAVYLGSMAGAAFRSLYRTMVQAALRAGGRVLAIGLTPEMLDVPDSAVFAAPFVPFSAAFPRCDAVIHHGGIGTAARVLKAGLPMLVVPWGYDQFVTGMMMRDAGVGRTIPARRCSIRAASTALRAVLADAHHRAAAARLSRIVADEDGVAALSRAIEERLA